MPTLNHYLLLSAVLFSIGTAGVFVRRNVGRNLETAIVHFHFNAWAKYRDWQKDRKVPDTAAAWLGKRLFDARTQGVPLVLEGGGIDVNGHGTLLTTEACLLNVNRNPLLKRNQIEKHLLLTRYDPWRAERG